MAVVMALGVDVATAILNAGSSLDVKVGVELDVDLVDVDLDGGALRVGSARLVDVVLRMKVVRVRVSESSLRECPRSGVVDIMIIIEQKRRETTSRLVSSHDTTQVQAYKECGVWVIDENAG